MDNIRKQEYSINRSDRCGIKNHNSCLIWFTGLSGSGKSTIANLLEKELFSHQIHTYSLDGDNLRRGLNKDLKFTKEDRNENLRRTAEVSRLFLDAGTVVIAAFITPYQKIREEIKNIVGAENYIEIYVKTPIEVCEKRDVKGLYKKARAGEIKNFTGISSPFETPLHPTITIETTKITPAEAVVKIVNLLKERNILKKADL